ncbi:hypothetical protein K1719_039955 [Acacia pycnantha]|nr:hypothetical protein K1719_039955 [Acacia pycnantha]
MWINYVVSCSCRMFYDVDRDYYCIIIRYMPLASVDVAPLLNGTAGFRINAPRENARLRKCGIPIPDLTQFPVWLFGVEQASSLSTAPESNNAFTSFSRFWLNFLNVRALRLRA